MKPTILLLALLVALGIVAYLLRPAADRVDSGGYRIAMAGRSTMELWFKHWNWPRPLRQWMTYRPWPIAYRKFSRGDLTLEYVPLAAPRIGDPKVQFGESMLESFTSGLESGEYDAAFFKFCFVDFPVDGEEERASRLADLTTTIEGARRIAAERGLRLIVGNALPLARPSPGALELQKDYNEWLGQFAASRSDVMVFDLFGPLSDPDGSMNTGLARSPHDPHPGDQAFDLLDGLFFDQVTTWMSSRSDDGREQDANGGRRSGR